MTKEEIKASPVGLRFNKGKLRWGLMHYPSMESMIRVLEYGSQKYTANNWTKGMNKLELLECLQRHLAALMEAEAFGREEKKYDHDPECEGCKTDFCPTHSQQHHIGHILCNAMMYAYYELPENKDKAL
jgi:hypothetical protein